MSDAYATSSVQVPKLLTTYTKPIPQINQWNKPFWDATLKGKFLAQRDEQGNVWFPPGPVSPFTGSGDWTWAELSGRGTVASWVVFHQQYFKGFGDDLPYNVALVELDEGPRIFTNLVNVDNDKIQMGMRVKAVFRPVNETLALPVFELVREDV